MSMINAYYLLQDVRDNLHESSEVHWDDAEILRKMNQVQMEMAMHLMMIPGGWLLKSGSVTPVASVITLPSDCAKPVYLEVTADNIPLRIQTNVNDRSFSRLAVNQSGNVYEAYMLRNSIEVNMSGFTDPCTLWYHERVPDLHAGTAATGTGASALTFDKDNEPRFADDYYNNVTVEIIDQTSGIVDISSNISDYAGGTVTATITGTGAAGDFYGTISKLPDECQMVLVLKATLRLLSKPSAAVDDKYFERFTKMEHESWLTMKQWFATRANDARHTRITEVWD